MKLELHVTAAVASICSLAALLSACGSGGNGTAPLYNGKTTQANIGVQSVKITLAGVQEVIPSCTATGLAKQVAGRQSESVRAILKITRRALQPALSIRLAKSVSLISTTAPLGLNGDCGGTLSYPAYSHSGGTTTMLLKWDDYCTTDISGNKTTYDGTLSVVDKGTPGTAGPVTTKLTAGVPALAIVERNSVGTVISSVKIALTGFEYLPDSGASADPSNLPGSTTLKSLEVKDVLNNRVYKLADVAATTVKSASDTQLSMTGRIYQGTTGYTELATDNPILIDPTGNLKSGTISFTGAEGHKALLTVVPGVGQNFSVAVDADPIPGVQLNCNGL